MRRILAWALLIVVVAGCIPAAGTPTGTATPRPVLTIAPQDDVTVLPRGDRPNIIFILTDDLDLKLGTIQYMPHLQESLVSQGLTVETFFISQPFCCPSRATFLRGQYTHNHRIYGNNPPNGGFQEFYLLEHESSTVATWLQAAGYRTVLLGKYLNGYPFREDREYVPVGWDEWYSAAKGSPFAGYRYTLNENGVQVDYAETGQGESQYMTDVLARKASDFIQRTSQADTPFFMYLSTYAPHVPVKPAKRHETMFPELTAPRTESFNEQDVSDKPAGIRFDPLLSAEEIATLDLNYRLRVQAMQAVDEMIAQLIDTLEETSELENTYIIFTSDNGYHLGQHRLRSGKGEPYEEDIRVPFILRGPGLKAGTTLHGYLTGNADLAPTIAELAGVTPPAYVDGRSLAPLLLQEGPPGDTWRSGYLLESYGNSGDSEDEGTASSVPVYLGLRTADYLYVEYQDGFVELYDLKADPHQLENVAGIADKGLLEHLSQWLQALANCAGEGCRVLDREPTR